MSLADSPTEPPDRWIGALLAETYRVKRLLGEAGMGGVYEAEHTRLPRRFAVKRLLGEGGMGAVYEAQHTRLPRSFAVKVLSDATFKQQSAATRFRREAEIASRLKHRHIVEVVDYNVASSGQPYIVMELLEGEDLSVRLARVGPLPLELAVSVTHQVASALATAHGQGVVHRDLKPQNIFLCRQADRDDFVKVLDFGISKILGVRSSLTGDQAIVGTPWYMAPEQARGESSEVDHRADVFALGAILFEMLAGRVPFMGESPIAALHAVIYEDPPTLVSLRPGLPVPLEAAVMRALSKRPEDRFQQVGELVEAVVEAAELGLDLSGEHLVPEARGRSTRPPTRPPSPSTFGDTLVAPSGELERGRARGRRVLLGGGILLLAGGGVLGVTALSRTPGSVPAVTRDASAPAIPDLPREVGLARRESGAARGDAGSDRARNDLKPSRPGRLRPKTVVKPKRPAPDWIRKPEVGDQKPAPKVVAKPEPRPPPKLEPKPAPKVEPRPKPKTKDWIVKPPI